MMAASNYYSGTWIASAVARGPIPRAADGVVSARPTRSGQLAIRHIANPRVTHYVAPEHLRVIERMRRHAIVDEFASPNIELVDVGVNRKAVEVAIRRAIAVVDEDACVPCEHIVRLGSSTVGVAVSCPGSCHWQRFCASLGVVVRPGDGFDSNADSNLYARRR
jgi:hypothetical protein